MLLKVANEDGIAIKPNGAVELYYDNVKIFETIGGGAKITGGHGAGLEIENGGTNLAAQFKLKNSTVGKQYTLGVAGNTGNNFSENLTNASMKVRDVMDGRQGGPQADSNRFTVGQTRTLPNGTVLVWNGTSWVIQSGGGNTTTTNIPVDQMTDKQKQQMMIRLSRIPEIKMWEGENLY